MQSKCTYLPYSNTGFSSTIITDYLSGEDALKPFYDFNPNIEGIKAAIGKREFYNTNRQLLVEVLNEQYKNVPLSVKQQENLQQLASKQTFTICTAHQPNIFTGYLYFIYKIIHAVVLAEKLSAELHHYNFVPVYYMGSEDADLEELGHIQVDGQEYKWETKQTGAVGRMKVDRALATLIADISGQLLVHPFGEEIVELMKNSYKEGITIQQATFDFVNSLFGAYGLLILLPDNRLLKNAFVPVMKKELLEQFSHKAVKNTIASFPSKYKVQASGRELNLFYLTDEARERIEKINSQWKITNTKNFFSEGELLDELRNYPERFSPNVILRPLFQETLLPNIAFIGGGGEIAYWLELKGVFEAAQVPYPVLVLRNSFLLVDKESDGLIKKLNLYVDEIFKPAFQLVNELVKKQSNHQLELQKEKAALSDLYRQMGTAAAAVDSTLEPHVQALMKRSLDKIEALEKKMLRAERLKFESQQRQLHKLKQQLFPNSNLQERVENFMLFYAKNGKRFIENIYLHSLGLEQKFAVMNL